jgi:hypothetical protein
MGKGMVRKLIRRESFCTYSCPIGNEKTHCSNSEFLDKRIINRLFSFLIY